MAAVRIAVAKSELIFFTPILADTVVCSAKKARGKASYFLISFHLPQK